jgi:3-oxoacyl-[acyl-carrier protein] reductase
MNNRKYAFITGCSGSLGKDILQNILKKNYEVICHSRKTNKDLKQILNTNKKNIKKVLNFDLLDNQKIDKQLKNLCKNIDHLDLVILNAAVPHGGLLEMTKINDIKKTFEINFFSQIYIIQKLLRLLKKSTSPSIILISSIASMSPSKGNIAYGGSKAAVNYATKVLAEEFANYNIRVNSIAPIVINNDMGKKMDTKSKNEMISSTFQKKILKNSDIINMISFLISQKSKRINGQILRIDGGMKF